MPPTYQLSCDCCERLAVTAPASSIMPSFALVVDYDQDMRSGCEQPGDAAVGRRGFEDLFDGEAQQVSGSF